MTPFESVWEGAGDMGVYSLERGWPGDARTKQGGAIGEVGFGPSTG